MVPVECTRCGQSANHLHGGQAFCEECRGCSEHIALDDDLNGTQRNTHVLHAKDRLRTDAGRSRVVSIHRQEGILKNG